VSFDERVDMDMFYIHNWSIGMDLYILVNTVWIVAFSRGYGSS
jgi:lipopolysaccharide/colanic/teichoic acid biosynthesis glycosyltransferase